MQEWSNWICDVVFVFANKTCFYQEVYIIKYLRKREDKSGLTFFGLYFLFLTIQILQLKYLLTFEVWGRSGYIFSQGPHEKKCETEHSANLHPVFIFTFPWHLVFTWCRCIDLFTAVKAYRFAFIESRTSTFVLKTVSSTDIHKKSWQEFRQYDKTFTFIWFISSSPTRLKTGAWEGPANPQLTSHRQFDKFKWNFHFHPNHLLLIQLDFPNWLKIRQFCMKSKGL